MYIYICKRYVGTGVPKSSLVVLSSIESQSGFMCVCIHSNSFSRAGYRYTAVNFGRSGDPYQSYYASRRVYLRLFNWAAPRAHNATLYICCSLSLSARISYHHRAVAESESLYIYVHTAAVRINMLMCVRDCVRVYYTLKRIYMIMFSRINSYQREIG